MQQALASELDMQAIYDVVGDKIREIFNEADVSIRLHDPQTNLIHYPYYYERGAACSSLPLRLARRGSPPMCCVRAKPSS